MEHFQLFQKANSSRNISSFFNRCCWLILLLRQISKQQNSRWYTGVVSYLSTRGQPQTVACRSTWPKNGNIFVSEALMGTLAVSKGPVCLTLTFNQFEWNYRSQIRQNDRWEEDWMFMWPHTNINFSDRIQSSAALSIYHQMVGVTDCVEKKLSTLKNSAFQTLLVCKM